MAIVKVESVLGQRGDLLLVRGTVDGVAVEARGWKSAVTNHFPPSAYEKNGHRKPNAVARQMTQDEALAYCRALLETAAAGVDESAAVVPDETTVGTLVLADLVDAK